MIEIQVNQSLHGYLDGHQLLQTSLPLSRRSSRDVLVLSDLSGTVIPGFDGYLTGYYLQSDKLYALAKTWYAYEAPRPGAVWTHTLYIRREDFQVLDDLEQVSRLFARPEASDLSFYGQPLHVSVAPELLRQLEEPGLTLNDTLDRFVHRVVKAYYQGISPFCVFPTDDPREHIGLYFALWRQGWPSLRSRLSFCTAAADIRYLGEGGALDLQSVPRSSFAIVRRRAVAAGATIIDKSTASDGREVEEIANGPGDWADLLAQDLLFGVPRFRRFTELIGPFVPDVPTSMKELASLYCGIERQEADLEETQRIGAALASEFPKPSQGLHLKSLFLTGKLDAALGSGSVDSEAILLAALSLETGEAFDDTAELLTTVLLELRSNRSDRLDLVLARALGQFENNKFARLIIRCVTSSFYNDEEFIHSLPKNVAVAVFVSRPDLILSPSFARLSTWQRREITHHLVRTADVSSNVGYYLVLSALRDGHDEFAPICYEKWPNSTVRAILDYSCQWFIGNKGAWTGPLSNFPAFIAEWLRENRFADERAFRLVVGVAHFMELSPTDQAAWRALVSDLDNTSEAFARRVGVIVMILAYDNKGFADSILGELFVQVYDRLDFAVSRSRMSDWEWFSLQDRLPELSYWEDWDRAKRLRLGAIEIAAKYRISPQRIAETISDQARANQFDYLIAKRG